ncbi:hypothetical protein B0H10DRAFT_2206670 [Mycena sp. CBHHK59/15]|nr:hypothetical protein B0H10DRAFT_2206670 [Mycena sp. CBHHK59/15]
MSRKDYESLSQWEAQDVRKSVNAACKKGASASTRRVTAVAAHVDISAGSQIWATRAYQSSVADTITLRFKVIHEIHGKPNGVQVRNLSEGEPNVLATISPTALRDLAIRRIEPKVLVALRGYQMPWERIVLWEISTWVDLAQQPPDIPYFYERCITGKPKGKDNAKTFKKPAKAFELALVIDPDHWEEISEYLADNELDAETTSRSAGRSRRSSTTRKHMESDSEPESGPGSPSNSDYGLNSASFGTVQNSGGPTESESIPVSSKRQRSASNSLPRTPPASKRRAVVVYESPNHGHLRDALLEGGSYYSQVPNQARCTFEQIEFFHILERPLNELLSSREFQGFACDPAHAAEGSLGMENGRYLGIGTFKTAHPAYLTLIHLAAEGLGTTPNENVAIKLMYVRRAKPTESQPDGWIINRLMPADEYRKIIMEANVLLWVISIMTFTYSFIYHFIRTSPHPPPSRSPTFDSFTLV